MENLMTANDKHLEELASYRQENNQKSDEIESLKQQLQQKSFTKNKSA